MNRIIVLLSGGMDSATLCYDLSSRGETLIPLFVDYGQSPAPGEQRAASYIAQRIGVPLTEVRAPYPELLATGGLFPGSGNDNWESPLVSFVPHRNLVLLTIASLLGISLGVDRIAIGLVHDGGLYPDTSAAFCERATLALRTSHPALEILAPYVSWSKQQVVSHALHLGVPVEATFSCHFRSDHHCGGCPACEERTRLLPW